LKILTIQIGVPQNYPGSRGNTITTSIYRNTTLEPVHLFKDHLDGDQPSNTKAHGGVEKAVNIYPVEHYPFWRDTLNMPLPENGSFGENFTTEGWLEEEACIGDIYQIGEAFVQVSQPRQPCSTLAWRWGNPDFIRLVNEAGRTGWYLRVQTEGRVQAGDEIVQQSRPFPEWTIAKANATILHPRADVAATRALAECPALSPAWVMSLTAALR